MRPAPQNISIPEFPPGTEWINAPAADVGLLPEAGAVLVWFWDCASLNSLRALPYASGWHGRYANTGLRVIGVHSPQFDFGHDRAVVARAVERHGIEFPVAADPDHEIWRRYGNQVWPALYLWDKEGLLRYYHFAEGEYEQTERAIQEALREIDPAVDLPEPMAPLRATDAPGTLVRTPTPHRYLEPDRSGRSVSAGDELSISYSGAIAAAVLDGEGQVEVLVDSRPAAPIALDGPGLYVLVDSPEHEEHDLTLRFAAQARAYAFSFGPGPA